MEEFHWFVFAELAGIDCTTWVANRVNDLDAIFHQGQEALKGITADDLHDTVFETAKFKDNV